MRREYDNFALDISREGDAYVVRVSVGELGEAEHPFPPPFRGGDLKALLAGGGTACRDLAPVPVERRAVQGTGHLLFSSVFGGRVGTFWDTCLQKARQSGRGLRLQLRLRSPELWEWPWEYLYDPDEDFLALLPDVSIARYPEMPRPARGFRVDPPLRVLVAAAHPRDCRRLGVEREWKTVKSAWETIASPDGVELELLESASLGELRRALCQPFHILHFIGHGEFDPVRRRGALLFEKTGGEREPVSGRRLIRVLRRQPALRLVVLNACEGARTDREDPFAGVAQRLVHGQIPAVVAMQFRVADDAAIVFSRRFYEALAEGMPVDGALSEARLALDAEPFGADWGNPVLYMRSSDGRIFEVVTPAPPEPAVATETPPNGQPRLHSLRRWWIWAALALLSPPLGLATWRWSTQGPPLVATDPGCPSPPGLDMPFARILPGHLSMGKARNKEEGPEHPVRITKPYCIGKFEVTQRQWKKIMGDNPSRHQDDDRPVEGVSWEDAQNFLRELNDKDPSGHYRLPTEAEWEFAAFSGGGSPDPEDLRRYGNCLGWLDFYRKTAPVGSFQPNAKGIYDLYGNVAEWVTDWYGPYSADSVTDPTGPAVGTEKVRRGGFFGNKAENCSVSYRSSAKPERRAEDTGFRVVRESTVGALASNAAATRKGIAQRPSTKRGPVSNDATSGSQSKLRRTAKSSPPPEPVSGEQVITPAIEPVLSTESITEAPKPPGR